MTKKGKIAIGIIALLVVAGVGGFLYMRNNAPTMDGDVVYIQKVSDLTRGWFAAERYSGVVEAQKTQIYKRDAERLIEEIYVSVGDEVKVGTPLYKYDVKQAENTIESAYLDIEGINNEIAVLRAAGNTTEIQLAIAEKELEIKQKQADVENLKKEIENSEVLSVTAGTVKSINPDGGYDNNGNELPLIAATEEGDFRVKGKISEQSIGLLTVGQEVIIRSRVDESKTWAGTINSIEKEPETSQNDMMYYGSSGESASSYPFFITMPSTEGLMLGQHVFIEPDYGQGVVKEGLWLDMSFIDMDENGDPFVWVSKNGKTAKRKVEVGEMDEDLYEVQILDGLSNSDYIAWPDESITEGMKTVEISEDL